MEWVFLNIIVNLNDFIVFNFRNSIDNYILYKDEIYLYLDMF